MRNALTKWQRSATPMFLGGQTLSSLSSRRSTPALYSDHCIEEILKARTHANMGAARHSWTVRGGIEPGARGVLCHVGKHLEWRSMYNPFPHFSPGQPANNDLGASGLSVNSRDAEKRTRRCRTLHSERSCCQYIFWRPNPGPDKSVYSGKWAVSAYYHIAGQRSGSGRQATMVGR